MASVATWIFLPGASMRSTCRRRKKYPASCVLPPGTISPVSASWGGVPDHPPIIDKEIAYRGDVVAVVAAETYEAACIAVDKIKITYTRGSRLPPGRGDEARGALYSELDSNIINRHHGEGAILMPVLPPPAISSNVSMRWGSRSTAILSRNRLPPTWTIMNRS